MRKPIRQGEHLVEVLHGITLKPQKVKTNYAISTMLILLKKCFGQIKDALIQILNLKF